MNGEKALSLQKVISEIASGIIRGIHTAIPAVIDSYNHKKMLCNARPSINTTFDDGVVVATPMIYNVPVLFPRSRKAAITFPLEKGDTVLLVFAERSLDEWIEKGGNKVSPEDPRRHDMSDAIAIPGCFHAGAGKLPSSDSDLEIQYGDQYINIKKDKSIEIKATLRVIIDSPSVELGGKTIDPTDGVVTSKCSCMLFSSVPHAVSSMTVKAKL